MSIQMRCSAADISPDRIEAGLPAATRALLRAATSIATASDVELWIVGGAVRDSAAGRALGDVDVAVGGDVGALAAAVARQVGGVATAEPRFLTASVRRGDHRLDLASFRTERYPRPGALPVVAPVATIEEDLPRRDFSVNAVAVAAAGDRRGERVDPFRGMEDLATRRLRALHPRSFVEDATRLWRGARIAAALNLRAEPQTAQWIEDGSRWISAISGRRLRAELVRTAAQRPVGAIVRLLHRWGVLRGVHPWWCLPAASDAALRHRPGPHRPETLIATLLAPLPERAAILSRLAASRAESQAVRDTADLLATAGEAPETLATLTRASKAGRTAARWLDAGRQQPLQLALRRWERTRSPLHAEQLIRMGVAPGPAIGCTLDRLRRARYLGTLSSAAEARAAVRAWLATETPLERRDRET